MALLSLDQRQAVEPQLLALAQAAQREGCELPSDPWFANLWLFRGAHAWRLEPGAWPVVRGRAYDQTELVLPLFDLSTAPVHIVLALQGDQAWFGPLSDHQRQALAAHGALQISLRDEADYVYGAQAFRIYRGSVLRKKANLVRQLERQFTLGDHVMMPRDHVGCLRVLQGWLLDKGKQPGDADEGPCREALEGLDALALHGQVFTINGQIVGFLIWQALRPDTHVIRFAKARDVLQGQSLKGLYPAMFQRHCLNHSDLRWINFEPDLGLANFRHTKQSFQPQVLLSKWRVRVIQPVDTRP